VDMVFSLLKELFGHFVLHLLEIKTHLATASFGSTFENALEHFECMILVASGANPQGLTAQCALNIFDLTDLWMPGATSGSSQQLGSITLVLVRINFRAKCAFLLALEFLLEMDADDVANFPSLEINFIFVRQHRSIRRHGDALGRCEFENGATRLKFWELRLSEPRRDLAAHRIDKAAAGRGMYVPK
jgi:hypothetical protein